MQEALCTAYEKLYTLKDAEKFRAWLLKIAANSAYDILRRRGRTVPLEDLEPAAADHTEDKLSLWMAVQQLPADYRTVGGALLLRGSRCAGDQPNHRHPRGHRENKTVSSPPAAQEPAGRVGGIHGTIRQSAQTHGTRGEYASASLGVGLHRGRPGQPASEAQAPREGAAGTSARPWPPAWPSSSPCPISAPRAADVLQALPLGGAAGGDRDLPHLHPGHGEPPRHGGRSPRWKARADNPVYNESIQAINEDVEALTSTLIAQFEADAAALGEEAHTALEVRHRVVTNSDTWFTLEMEIWLGSGSSNTYYRYYHLDKTTGEIMELPDLFRNDGYMPGHQRGDPPADAGGQRRRHRRVLDRFGIRGSQLPVHRPGAEFLFR